MLARAITFAVELLREIGIKAHNTPRFLDVSTISCRHVVHTAIKDAFVEVVLLQKHSHLVVLPISA